MPSTGTTVPADRSLFNQDRDFVILFELYVPQGRTYEPLAQLSMVWRAPALPQPGQAIRLSTHAHQLCFTVAKKQRGLSALPPSYVEWGGDRVVSMNAILNKTMSPRQFLDEVQGLVDTHPTYPYELSANLHIYPATEMLESEADLMDVNGPEGA